MFKSVPTRGLSDNRSPPTVPGPEREQDDDNISLTSTVAEEHASDEEFEVKDIHMESEPDPGEERLYLVEWKGYPLHECTWEPESHIKDLTYWKEKKERQRRGEEEMWTWETYESIGRNAELKKRRRHRLRNARRRRLGLPETEPFDDSSSESSDHSSSVEAEESRTLADISAERHHSRDESKATNFKSEKPSQPPRQKPADENHPRPGLARKISKDAAPSGRQERPTSTGYQGTARKPSATGQSTGSRPRGILSNSSRGPKVKLTARKTAQVAGNVFAGGKTRKVRQGLKDLMSDPTRQPKMFPNHHIRRLAEKHSRDKADGPPPLQPNMFVDLKAPRRRTSGTEPTSATSVKIQSPLTADGPNSDFGMTHMASEPESMTAEARKTPSGIAHGEAAPISAWDAAMKAPEPTGDVSPWDVALPKQPKRKKSVRFFEEPEPLFVDDSVPMDIDSDDTPDPEPQVSIETRIRVPRPNVPTRIVETKLQFGFVQGSEPVVASMDGVPTTSEDPWLLEFLKTETLQLEYTCSATDFGFQRQSLWQNLLCSGTVTSGPSSPVLETVATYLREGAQALFQTTSNYSVIVYPTSTDDWRSLLVELGIPASNDAGTSLKYCIFRSSENYAPWLRRPTVAKVPETRFNSFEEKLMWRLFQFDYQILLPAATRETKHPAHQCFLLFPRNRYGWLEVLARWIRTCNPKCRIYTSYDSGSWAAFCDAVKPRSVPSSAPAQHLSSSPGIVIVHELLLPSIRRLSDLWHQLHQQKENFWCFSEALQPGPVLSSMAQREVLPPGELRLIPLFPAIPRRSVAMFLTPSFLSSQPKQVFEVLQWFYDHFAARRSTRCKLLTATDFPGYLEEIARQKSRERERLLDEYKGDVVRAEIAANVAGLSHDDCEYWRKAFTYALEIATFRKEDVDAIDEPRYLQYAEPCIDQNDEQSLVNWFGRWSMWRLDQFRGFHVVGSSSSMKSKGARKGLRKIRIPNYSRCTLNDPDLVRDEVLRLNAQTQAAEIARVLEVQQTAAAPPADPSLPPPRPGVFQSKHVSVETAPAFTSHLKSISRHAKQHLLLNVFPVSWTDSKMAVHFRDLTESYQTLPRWFKFLHPFSRERPMNTYVGYFYTPAVDDWDPAFPPMGRRVRHPWICVYRSVSGLRHPPIGACEILIWDPAAPDRVPDDREVIGEQDLAYGQRKAVEYIREHTGRKNPGSYIKYVWYGGFLRPTNVDSPYPVDLALGQLDLMVEDMRAHLPLLPIHLAREGYREVVSTTTTSQRSRPSSPSSTSQRMDIDPPHASSREEHLDEESDDDTKILFHPPPGKPLPEGKRTRCFNRLYEEARDARRERRADTVMRYEFPVTTEWYDVQRQEGRGFEHINVAPWESVFQVLQIGSYAKPSHALSEGTRTPSYSERSFGRT
ncbi:hypothetical protein GE09DRAFT_946368 [Coniochaeta sp. 2T2.1]|nr:hypothetical protein GE09DRAFT_946368 [Coniochaeta sp. 2T2.1]